MYCPNCGEELRCDCSNCATKNAGKILERSLKRNDVPQELKNLADYGLSQCGKCGFTEKLYWWEDLEWAIYKSQGYYKHPDFDFKSPKELVNDFNENPKNRIGERIYILPFLKHEQEVAEIHSPAYIIFGISVVKVLHSNYVVSVIDLERMSGYVEQASDSSQAV